LAASLSHFIVLGQCRSAEIGRDALEGDRLALLKNIETSGFFQKVRGNLVTGIYNNKGVWPIFGYEGESASKGGYIDRGFNDLDWL
jgi:hypothetical protein